MKAESRPFRLLFVSPWPLLIFLVLPLLVILSVTLNVPAFLLGSARSLLVNNICFAFVAGCRLLRYLAQLKKTIRYGSVSCRPRKGSMLSLPISEARALLATSGYSFDRAGGYGEKRDLGYLGTTVLYGGLFLLLSIGCWDNLRQFAGVLLDGMGPATDLNKIESYRSITHGPFAVLPTSLPRMRIENQYLPDATYPMGATDLTLLSADGNAQKVLLKPREPVRVGAYDLYMAKLVFEPEIVINRSDINKPLFDSVVTLDPLVEKRGVYSFYGLFQGYSVGGGVYYQPEKNNLMVVIARGGQKVVTNLVFQTDQQVTQGDYIISCAKMGQWSEIHVVHHRHMGLLVFGGIAALMGLLLRIAIRPRRVWLEETPEGNMIWSTGKDTMNLLKTKD
jgi:hypothetical protein